LVEAINNFVYSFKSLISKGDIASIALVFLSQGIRLDVINECIEARILLDLLADLIERS